MAQPSPGRRPMNYEDAFAYLFRRPGGWGILATGGVLLLFFWLIVPLLVVIGFGVALGRMVAEGRQELPRFELGMAGDGLRAVVVMFGYTLPMLVLYLVAIVPLILTDTAESDAVGGIFVAAGILVFVVFILYALAFAALQPAIFAIFIAEGSIGACFSPRRLKVLIRHWGGTYFAVAAILLGISQLVGFGIILFFIGIAFTYFYFMAVAAHFAGQLSRPLLRVTSPTPPSDWTAPKAPATPPLAEPTPPATDVTTPSPVTPESPSGPATPLTPPASAAAAEETPTGAATEDKHALPPGNSILEVPPESPSPPSTGKPPPPG